MYVDFYQLNQKPYNLTPDSEFLFMSRQHKEALGHLRYGLDERKGFILITGEIGAGKTTLCRALTKELREYYNVALVVNPMVSPVGLMKEIVSDLNISYKGRSKQNMLQALSRFLLKGNEVVVIIDEAQDLSRSALEQIRLISNLETEKDKLLQLVLVGQPELRDKLKHKSLCQLDQRIAVRYHIKHMNKEETTFYIFHRLNIAGAKGRIRFEEDALEIIYDNTKGIPRVINILCDYCLMAAFIEESWLVTGDMAKRAVREYGGEDTIMLDSENHAPQEDADYNMQQHTERIIS